MKRIKVTNKDGREWQAEFAEERAQSWIDEQKFHGSWGSDGDYTIQIEDISAEKQQEAQLKQDRALDVKAQLALVKAIDWASVDTIAELKAVCRVYEKLIKHLVRESLREE